MYYMTEIEQKIEDYKMKLLNDRLSQCTENQQERFHELFTEENLKEEDYYISALLIIERTIAINMEEG